VKKWTTLDSAQTPDGRSLVFAEHDGDYSISVGGAELMSTRKHHSEEVLAELACAGLRHKKDVRVLIGGLGLGFTLKAALGALGHSARVVQAEILPAVIAWNSNPEYKLGGEALQDPRVSLVQQDVAKVIRDSPRTFDAIMLDVDNGPAALTVDGNRGLYVLAGLNAVYAALKPGGCVVYWAAAPDLPFEKLMSKAGFQVEVHRARAHSSAGSWHTLYLGRRAAEGSGTENLKRPAARKR
jgi:spermidine synthase